MKPTLLPALLRAAVSILLAASCLVSRAQPSLGAVLTPGPAFARIDIPGIHNAFQVTDKVYSGSQPEGEEAFAALARRGVKTIISVDGSKPAVEAARRHGLRYIHLPFGYDGVPASRVAELAKAAAPEAGPLFVHCHHGLHRGPAAVALICEATAGWTTNQAAAWLHEAGTAPDYPGLYRAAVAFQQPTRAQIDAVKDLPEVARTSSLVEAMVAIDGHFAALKQSQTAGWKAPPGHADIAPAHEAMMLWEQFRELARAAGTTERPADYRAKLGEAEKAAESLRATLRDSPAAAPGDAAFNRVGASCAACHKRYRNE